MRTPNLIKNMSWLSKEVGGVKKEVTAFTLLEPMSPGQKEMKEALKTDSYEIVGLFGPTGTGKSLFSILYGLEAVVSGKYKRFVISRPIIDVVSHREYTVAELGEQYYQMASSYLRDILHGYLDWKVIENLKAEGRLVIADTRYLRGRTFDDSIILLDDAQSVSSESAIEIMMRIGRNSRLIVAGDPAFQTIGSPEAARIIREVLLGEPSAKVVDLGIKDIVRPGAKRGIKLLFEARMRARRLNDDERKVLDACRLHAPDTDVITVVDLVDAKKAFNITSPHTPDALIIVKEGFIGRMVGRKGERIEKIETEVEKSLRVVELTLDFTSFIRAMHPVSWVYKHVIDADFAGPELVFKVDTEAFGAFVGQKGFHIKFLETVFLRMMNVGVRVIEVAEKRSRRRR